MYWAQFHNLIWFKFIQKYFRQFY